MRVILVALVASEQAAAFLSGDRKREWSVYGASIPLGFDPPTITSWGFQIIRARQAGRVHEGFSDKGRGKVLLQPLH